MDFPSWLQKEKALAEERGEARPGILKRIERDHRVGYMTLLRCTKRVPVGPRIAERISAATGGEVSPGELCFPPPESTGDESAPNSELGSEAAS